MGIGHFGTAVTLRRAVLQGAVAYDIGMAWRQLHPAAGDGAPQDEQFNFPAAK